MTKETTKASAVETFILPETLDINAAAGLAASLLAAQGNPLVLNGSRVKRAGAQCLQILFSASKTWDRDSLSLSLSDPSEELKEAFRIAGVNMDIFYEAEIAR